MVNSLQTFKYRTKERNLSSLLHQPFSIPSFTICKISCLLHIHLDKRGLWTFYLTCG